MAKKRNAASLRAIAERAGLSLGAVSMALRGDPSIPAPTRHRVVTIASELGYKRNARISELMALLKRQALGQGQETLAFVLPVSRAQSGMKHYIDTSLEHARKRADERGYGLEVFEMEEQGITAQRLAGIIETRGIRAVLFGPHPEVTGAIPLDSSQLVTMAIGYSVVEPPMHRVVIDHYRNIRLAMAQLRARGYERIGLMLEKETDARARDLISAGFWDVGQRLPERCRLNPYVGPPDVEKVGEWKERMQPDAVVAYGKDWYALLTELGPVNAESLGYVFLDYCDQPDLAVAGVPYVNGPLTEVAIDQLIAALQVNEFGVPEFPRTTTVPCVWQEGDTIRPLTGSVEDPLFLVPSPTG